jgi:hypothetical protein
MGCFQQPVPRSIKTYSNKYIIEFIIISLHVYKKKYYLVMLVILIMLVI